MLPEFKIVNFVAPLFEAVKRSPRPRLSVMSPANEVCPENEAIGSVPLIAETSKVADGVALLIPNCPVEKSP